ncbi:LptF/LptG family permease [candidate division KSB1 bacterium]|nr:LptF/LptG family permease [candidate division KSB1 bacterium]
MIKILPKYLVKEHIGPFCFALLVINSIFILNLLFRELGKFMSKGLSLGTILEFIFLNLAWMIALSVPCAVLTATIMAFGRLSAENEITAIKAGGISLYQILPATLIVSLGVAGALIWFNNEVLPDFNHRTKLLMLDIARKKPLLNLEAGVIYTDIPNYNILGPTIKEINSTTYIENITIDDQTTSNIIKTIIAKVGEITFSEETGLVEITLLDGELQEIDINNPELFKKVEFTKHVIKIPMTEMLLMRSQSEYRGDREKSSAALMEGVYKNRQRILERRQKLNETVNQQLSKYIYSNSKEEKTLDLLILDHQRLNRKIKTDLNLINSYKKSIDRDLVEVHKKYSIPAVCVVFVLVGSPLGILARKQGWAAAAGLSIGFFLLYWAFLIGGESLADRQKISPFWGMWSPNILVGGLGIFLVLRTVRDTATFRWPQVFSLPRRQKNRNK